MKQFFTANSVSGLRWALGLVIFWEALHFVLTPAAARHFAQTGLPLWIRPALGWSEAMAALLFLVSAATRIAGFALLLIFVIAIAIHLLSRDFGIGGLIVYSMAVVVCITFRDRKIEASAV